MYLNTPRNVYKDRSRSLTKLPINGILCIP